MSNNVSPELSRIMAFSDGVFAIVITLLIFDIKLPTNPDPASLMNEADLLKLILSLLPKFICYISTFVIIGIYWTGHHAIFKHVINYNRSFMWLNNLFLMCVCIMPFPTSVLGNYYYTRTAISLYGLSLIFTGLALSALWRYVSNDYRLIDKTLTPEVIKVANQRILIAPIAALISIALSFLNTTLSLWVYLFAGLLYLIPSRIDKITQKESLG